MITTDTKVWSRLPPDVYIYFFRRIFAGDKGNKQELIAKFFTALYKECKRRGIKPEWDPTNYSEIDNIMANINFNERRRTSHSSSKHPKKSYAIANDTGTVDGTSNQVS